MNQTAIVTGSAGLIGSQLVDDLCKLGYRVIGIDNYMRGYFFGESSTTAMRAEQLQKQHGSQYVHHNCDIRDLSGINEIFTEWGRSVFAVFHAAAQPSHDWAAREPLTDFSVNATGTLNLLEATRIYCAESPFIFLSTNKVYGDRPNHLPLTEGESRFDLYEDGRVSEGISETMSIDQTLHSIFGVSKVSADVMVQEYGRYFGIPTACFRGGTLTGPSHAAAELHGFLAYLTRCALLGDPYTVFGYSGKQVRDVIHARDVSSALISFAENPKTGAVFNIGGGRGNSLSVLEAIDLVHEVTGHRLTWTLSERNRVGDHMWWITDNSKLHSYLPEWTITMSLPAIIDDIAQSTRPE